MQIFVIGRNPMGHNFVGRARRTWDAAGRTVEVVDVKAGQYMKDGPDGPVPCEDGDDPPDVTIERINPTTKQADKIKVADPNRIGRKSYDELLKDPRISIKQGDAISEQAADAAIGAARAEVARLSAENLELKAKIAQLETDLDAATSPKKGKARE